ncbi:MAG TPA: phosphate ABC transporter substrate-binding protein [Bacteroidia bacterium]|nr:phosphate ABC transporter substrate-binding protein [Bacteroidia bacterium]HNS11215.1 phosphate ABC transporter substrate-binding protein [Bacteroidia bacterium]
MKKIFSILLTVIFLSACSNNSSTENKNSSDSGSALDILIKGSDTVLPLAQKLAEEYMKAHNEAHITIVGGGSGVGLAALLDGTTDIAMSSRPIKQDEKLKLNQGNKTVEEFTLANDALSVVVNKSNPVKQLTREQLEGIFTGQIKNWKEVGGEDLKIIYYSRETSSGTYEFFREHVLNKKNFGNEALLMPATGAIVQSVSQTKGAIGYIGLAYDSKEVSTLAVSYDQGATYVMPSVEAAQDKSYPIARPLFFYFDKQMESKIRPFLDYALSPEGQAIVLEVGYVPLSK